jgi:hypothetical protein
MKYFVEILKQFSVKQRLFVLVLLLSFTSGGILLSQYFKTDDCRPIIQENLEMQRDFVKILEILRQERLKKFTLIDSVIIPRTETEVENLPESSMMDSIFVIAESHSK